MGREHSQSILSKWSPALWKYLVRHSTNAFRAESSTPALVRLPPCARAEASVAPATWCAANGTSLSTTRGRRRPASPFRPTKPIRLSYPQSNLAHVRLPWRRRRSAPLPYHSTPWAEGRTERKTTAPQRLPAQTDAANARVQRPHKLPATCHATPLLPRVWGRSTPLTAHAHTCRTLDALLCPTLWTGDALLSTASGELISSPRLAAITNASAPWKSRYEH